MRRYRAFGIVVSSDVPLPELPSAGEGPPEVAFALDERSPPQAHVEDPATWGALGYDDPGNPWSSVRRVGAEFEVRFWGLADFAVTRGAQRVRCRPQPGVPASTIRHLFLDHLLPYLMGHRGHLVLHASCAVSPVGALVFEGCSGLGKSTLAASFSGLGHRFLSDDAAVIDIAGARPCVIPAYPGVRLLPDNAVSVSLGKGTPPASRDAKKARFGPDRMARSFEGERCPLRRVYFLPPLPCPKGSPISIERVPQKEAFLRLNRFVFRLDPDDVAKLGTLFERVTDSGILGMVRLLRYPHDYSRLPEVMRAVLSEAAEP